MQLPHLWPRPVRVGLYALAVLILLYLTNAPQGDLPGVKTDDKVEHATAWLVLTAAGYALSPRRLWAIPIFAALFGALIEVLQAVLPFGRDAEVEDWVADCVGVGLAVLGYLLLRRVASAVARS